MESEVSKVQSQSMKCLRLILRPIARFCIRHAHTFQEFVNLARGVFIEVAEEELKKTTTKVNLSRISVLTGIYRRDIAKHKESEVVPMEAPVGLIPRLLAQWEQDDRYSSSPGKPKILSFQGQNSDFHKLVSSISQQLNPGTVLFELERSGLVEKTPRGLKLLPQVYERKRELIKGFEVVATDIEAMILSAEDNLIRKEPPLNLFLHTEYDNIFINDLPTIREWILDEGKALHKRAREFISSFDKDVVHDPKETRGKAGGKVMLSAFSLASVGGQKES